MTGGGVDKGDMKRLHERIDNTDRNQSTIKDQFNDVVIEINRNLVELNTNVGTLQGNTNKICKAVLKLSENIKDVDHKVHMHAATCPARRQYVNDDLDPIKDGVRYAKRHPIMTSGGIGGLIVASLKIVEYLFW